MCAPDRRLPHAAAEWYVGGMTDAARRLMSTDEFLEWCLEQEGRWELVDGVPVEMMAGAKQPHDVIVVNLITALDRRLGDGPRRPSTADVGARMTGGNLRRPDLTVDCGPLNTNSAESTEPTVFFEVLSPSTRGVDFLRKPAEYKLVPTLRHFVLLEAQVAYAWVWSRVDADRWSDAFVSGLDGVLELPGVGVSLPLSEVYRRLSVADPR